MEMERMEEMREMERMREMMEMERMEEMRNEERNKREANERIEQIQNMYLNGKISYEQMKEMIEETKRRYGIDDGK